MKNIVYACDHQYIQHFTVSAVSLLENSESKYQSIYLIYGGEKYDRLGKVKSFFRENYNVEIKIRRYDECDLSSFNADGHVSRATYARLLIHKILPKNVKKALYLDCDTVVCEDLEELEITKGSPLCAAPQSGGEKMKHLNHIKKFEEGEYFNAGVLLINTAEWRQIRVHEKATNISKKYKSDIKWWDQDILNLIFKGEWGKLDTEWNVQHNTPCCDIEEPKIIHYSGAHKPWEYMSDPPQKQLYWKYLKKTPFKKFVSKDKNLSNIIKKNIKVMLGYNLKGQ